MCGIEKVTAALIQRKLRCDALSCLCFVNGFSGMKVISCLVTLVWKGVDQATKFAFRLDAGVQRLTPSFSVRALPPGFGIPMIRFTPAIVLAVTETSGSAAYVRASLRAHRSLVKMRLGTRPKDAGFGGLMLLPYSSKE